MGGLPILDSLNGIGCGARIAVGESMSAGVGINKGIGFQVLLSSEATRHL